MTSVAWFRSPWAVTAMSVVAPPLGAAALWTTRARWFWKVLGSLFLALLTIVYLIVFFGMRVELSGAGTRPIFTFRNFERRMAALEENRAEQAKLPAPVPVEPVSAPVTEAPAVVAKTADSPGYWTDFRGPQRDGVYREMEILATWPDKGLTQLWKQPVGGGYASFVAGGGRIYTIEQRRDKEAVTAYDLKTGREIWAHTYPAFFDESMGGPGPRATPTYHAGIIYSLGAAGDLRVLDARTGTLKWSKNILKDNGANNIQWGMSASPLIVGETVVVQPGGNGASIVTYSIANGAVVWKSLADIQAYTSPMLVQLNGKRQILTVTAKRVVGLEPETGKLIWELPWETMYDVNSSQPIVIGKNQVLFSSGYGHGAALVEVNDSGPKVLWQSIRLKTRFSSAVLHDGYIYGLDDNILTCLRLSDGNQMWKGGRYGYGQLLLASGYLVILTESGEVALVKATPDKHEEVAKFSAIEGKTWNMPSIEAGVLLVRNAAEMAAFRIGK